MGRHSWNLRYTGKGSRTCNLTKAMCDILQVEAMDVLGSPDKVKEREALMTNGVLHFALSSGLSDNV